MKLRVYLLFLFALFPLYSNAQFVCRGQSTERVLVEDLKTCHGQNKIIPQEFELPCLIALSYFPELANVPIEFIFKRINTTMAARPEIISVFKNKKKRKYLITINSGLKSKNGLRLSEIPPDGQIGVIGHELSHIFFYSERSTFKLIKEAFGYFSFRHRKAFERNADLATISRGLEWQLFTFCDYVINSPLASERYKKLKKKYYLSPGEIRQYLPAEKTVYFIE